MAEYDELPVRHNEDKINTTLAGDVRWPTDAKSADDPHTKANLLLQVIVPTVLVLQLPFWLRASNSFESSLSPALLV